MAGWQGATYLSTLYVADGWLNKAPFVPPSISEGWLGADYLSARWVSDGYLPKAPLAVAEGAWVNQEYLARRWVSDTWLHHIVASAGAAVSVVNVPGLAIAVLAGSAKQTTRVNATEPTLPLVALATAVNAKTQVNQANVPGIALTAFAATANGSVYQIANVTFTVEVASTFGYTKAVVAQNVLAVPTLAIDAIVTLGNDVNVAATRPQLALAAFSTSVNAKTQTRAVTSVPLPISVFDGAVSIGRRVDVQNVLGIALDAIDASVVFTPNVPVNVDATLASLALVALNATVVGVSPQLAPVARLNRHKVVRRVDRSSGVIRQNRRTVI